MGCFILILMVTFVLPLPVMGQSQDYIRIGFSSTLLYGVNRNDAIAATRAWAQSLLNKQDISAVPKPAIFNSIAEIREALSNDMLDYISLTTNEYAEVRNLLPCEKVFVSVTSGSIMEEYLLIVRCDSKIESLKDLEGQKLRIVKSSRVSLSMIWLDTILLREGLGQAADFFGSIDLEKSLEKVILPVFFTQVDACIVTRKMFETMKELNPQIGPRLKAIAVSDPVVPSFFCFTKNSDKDLRLKVSREISRWLLSPVGKQSMVMFQCDSIDTCPFSCLESALNLIEEHKKLLNQIDSSNVAESALARKAG